jgi:acyl-coenzyme A thioesterase PaaI-like protein
MTDADDAHALADVVNATLEHMIPAAHRMGVKAVDVRRGFAAAMVPIDGNGNHFGVMYAGVLFTVAEILGGAIAAATFDSSAYYPLVKEMRISFTAPARSDVVARVSLSDDDIARITAEAAAAGKSEFTLDAVVTDENDVTVATTHGIYQIRAHGR